MSREILFRGKRTDNDKWLESVCPLGTLDTGAIINGVYPDTVCQYTGLKDCNGKMIFEGDIVREDDITHNGEVQIYGKTYFVRMREGCWVADSRDGSWRFLYVAVRNGLEVIGNIYDNPELLEGVSK